MPMVRLRAPKKAGHTGKIEASNNGTLFLNEIGDMAPELQTRLLQVLENQEITPLGSNRVIPVNIYVLCATHRALPELIAQGKFRQDLYYRLAGIIFRLPPLREREDKIEIINRILQTEAEADNEMPMHFSSRALEFLKQYDWPGNIRQLRNAIRTACAISDGPEIDIFDLPEDMLQNTDILQNCVHIEPQEAQHKHVDNRGKGAVEALRDNPELSSEIALTEIRVIEQALSRCQGNISQSARSLGISRSTFYRKMQRLGLIHGTESTDIPETVES